MEGVVVVVLLAFRKNVEHFLEDGLEVEAGPSLVPPMLVDPMKGAQSDATFSHPLLYYLQSSEL